MLSHSTDTFGDYNARLRFAAARARKGYKVPMDLLVELTNAGYFVSPERDESNYSGFSVVEPEVNPEGKEYG